MLSIVKIGGSIITRKNRPYTFNSRGAARVVRQLAPPVILIQGSGSFGKPPAVALGYSDGKVTRDGIPDISAVRTRLADLNNRFVSVLAWHRIPAMGLSATGLFESDSDGPRPVAIELLRAYVAAGITPVVYSDFVLRPDGGLAVVSSDALVAALAQEMQPDNVVFATDVDGVQESDCGCLRSRIYPFVDGRNFQTVYASTQRVAGDVTGGMKEKLLHAFTAAKHAGNVFIVNGLKGDALARTCMGTPPLLGTRVSP